MKFSKIFFALVFGLILTSSNVAQAGGGEGNEFDAGATAFHHIADANIYSIGPFAIDLPCILYNSDNGKWSFFSSAKFHRVGTHGDGSHIVDGYVLNGGTVMKIKNPTPEMLSGEAVAIATDEAHPFHYEEKEVEGKKKNVPYFKHNGEKFYLIKKSTLDAGLFGGGLTSFYDFSLTKNVVSMILVCALLLWLFISIANTYKRNVGKAPSGKQGFIRTWM